MRNSKRPRGADSESASAPVTEMEDAGQEDNLLWASYIKAHHQKIRDSVKKDHGGDADAAWRALLGDESALQRYAISMHHLATKYWDVPAAVEADSTTTITDSGEMNSTAALPQRGKFRYDDRIAYALHCVQEYFLGPVAGSGGGRALFLPMVVTIPLKEAKRAYYAAHQKAMPEAAQLEWVRWWLMERCDAAMASGSPSSGDGGGTHGAMPTRRSSTALRVTLEAFGHLYPLDNNVPPNVVGPSERPAVAPIRFLDVGSCYAPFEGKKLSIWQHRRDGDASNSAQQQGDHHHPPSQRIVTCSEALQRVDGALDVVSIDLAPYPHSTVWPCDWLAVEIAPPCGEGGGGGGHHHSSVSREPTALDQLYFSEAGTSLPGSSTTPSEELPPADVEQQQRPSYCGRARVSRISSESFDVVVFSLVLSYMPTPRMRFDACRKAHAVLKDYGLLIVISTRTQGPRQASWINDWVDAIERIGFVRVHKDIRCRLIGLTFQKQPQKEGGNAPCGGGEDGWETKMVITADTI